MNIKTTVYLLIAVLAFGGYIYFFERKMSSTDELKELKDKVVNIKSEEVIKIELKTGTENIACEKKGTFWEIIKPLTARADNTAISTLLSKIEFLQKVRELDIAAEFGLENPRTTILLSTPNRHYTLKIGQDTQLGNNLYISLNDSPKALVVDKSLLDSVNKNLADLRDKNLVYLDRYKIKNIDIRFHDKVFNFEKSNAYSWNIVKPLKTKGDDEKIEEFVKKLKDTKVEKFLSGKAEKIKEYALDKPLGEITIQDENQETEKIFLGKTAGEHLYAKKERYASILAVKPGIKEYWEKDINHFRNKDICALYSFEVETIEITNGKQKLLLKKETKEGEELWHIIKEAEKTEADKEKVMSYLENLREIKIQEFVADNVSGTKLKEYGLQAPAKKIVLRTNKNEKKNEILIGKTENDVCYLSLKEENSIYKASHKLITLCSLDESMFSKADQKKEAANHKDQSNNEPVNKPSGSQKKGEKSE